MKVNERDFWEDKYTQNCTPWDIGQAAPAFVKYFAKFGDGTTKKVAVLGSGKGHDAFYIASLNKYEVCGFDFSFGAIDFCNELKTKKNIKHIYFYQVNFFQLVSDTKWKNHFDYVIEHTSLCAIDPKLRKEYVNLIKYLLKADGKLVGLFFIRPKEVGGPPFGSTPEEIKELFQKDFSEVEKLQCEECLHGDNLSGEEWFGVFEKSS